MGRPYSRHGLTAAKARIRLHGFAELDRRTVGARAMLAFRDELVSALGGDADLSPQRRKLVDLAVRAAAYLDHIDAFLAAQESVITRHTRQPAVVPVLSNARPSLTTSSRFWPSSASSAGRDPCPACRNT
jgi:hypothetical protein